MAVTIDINANPKGFDSALDSMRAKATGFATHLSGLGAKIAGGFAAERIFEQAFAKLSQAADDYKELNAEIARGTALTGASAEQFQKVAFAAKLARVETTELEKGILQIRAASANAAKGDTDARETFTKLGIDPEKFGMADYAEQVLMLADAFETLAKKGDPVKIMLDALGSKNRSLIEFLGQGRAAIARTMETPGIAISESAHQDAEARARGAKTTEQQRIAAPATQRVIEAQRIGKRAVNWATQDIAETVVGADIIGQTVHKEFAKLPPGVIAAAKAAETAAESKTSTEKKRLTTPIPELFGTPSERASMAERQHELEFRNAQLLQANLDEKLKALTGERLRFLTSATDEKDPQKAFDLLMKGNGMESEIMSLAREVNAPETLSVKAGHIAEMGGGGPVATFGGIEVKIGESTNYLREIRDKLLGPGSGFFWTPGHIADGEGPNMPAGVYPTARPVSVENFDKER